LNTKQWEGPAIKARMGIHSGRAEIQRDGEYRGYLTLTRVQRVMSAAELALSDLPNDVSLQDMGEHRLKGLLQTEHLWQVVAAGLPPDFPPLATLDSIPNNLPA
jgi:class 3 adenylate cyclase